MKNRKTQSCRVNCDKMLKKTILLFLTITSISNCIEIPAWDFEMNEYEMTVGGRLDLDQSPGKSKRRDVSRGYLSLVIDPYYPKADRNESVCKSFGPFDIPEKTFNASTCFDSNSSSTKCGEFWAGCCFDSEPVRYGINALNKSFSQME